MNINIIRLAEKAGARFEFLNNGQGFLTYTEYMDIELFAQLIVKECRENISEYFGVKE